MMTNHFKFLAVTFFVGLLLVSPFRASAKENSLCTKIESTGSQAMGRFSMHRPWVIGIERDLSLEADAKFKETENKRIQFAEAQEKTRLASFNELRQSATTIGEREAIETYIGAIQTASQVREKALEDAFKAYEEGAKSAIHNYEVSQKDAFEKYQTESKKIFDSTLTSCKKGFSRDTLKSQLKNSISKAHGTFRGSFKNNSLQNALDALSSQRHASVDSAYADFQKAKDEATSALKIALHS
jgi:hypothetical protein